METRERAPLLSTINTILLNKGFVPVDGVSGLYKKTGGINQPLSIEFMRVTDRHVTLLGKNQERQSHLRFVTGNTKHIFR